jgi:hypothetical protein
LLAAFLCIVGLSAIPDVPAAAGVLDEVPWSDSLVFLMDRMPVVFDIIFHKEEGMIGTRGKGQFSISHYRYFAPQLQLPDQIYLYICIFRYKVNKSLLTAELCKHQIR